MVLLAIEMALLLLDNWMSANWGDVHLSGDG
jgi:hypothetical protein